MVSNPAPPQPKREMMNIGIVLWCYGAMVLWWSYIVVTNSENLIFYCCNSFTALKLNCGNNIEDYWARKSIFCVLKPQDDGSWLYFESSSFLFTFLHCLTCIVNIFSPEGLVQYHRTILRNLELRIGRTFRNI